MYGKNNIIDDSNRNSNGNILNRLLEIGVISMNGKKLR